MISKSLANCVVFARFVKEHKVDPSQLAELISLAHRAFKASERDCNEGTEKSQKNRVRAHSKLESLAAAMGFTVHYYGLWPTLGKGEQQIALPSLD